MSTLRVLTFGKTRIYFYLVSFPATLTEYCAIACRATTVSWVVTKPPKGLRWVASQRMARREDGSRSCKCTKV